MDGRMKRINTYTFTEITFETDNRTSIIEDCCQLLHEETNRTKVLSAFRKNGRIFAVRMLAEESGHYQYQVDTGDKIMTGEFRADEATGTGKGIVRVKNGDFYYSDGQKYLPFGTTCYGWINQDPSLQEQTIQTLAGTCFNKIRMLVFPKFMPYNREDPKIWPFEKEVGKKWNVNAIVPAFWENLDLRLAQLRNLGIQADLILFHPYDKWGFSELSQEDSITYIKYCMARFSAYTNIWWSLANEYEMLLEKKEQDWDAYGRLLMEKDPYQHLRSIHQIISIFPKRDWMTHCSVQSGNINYLPKWKKEYGIPVIIDECGYEGDLEFDWGNLSAFEMVHRFWWTVMRGGYCTHGETFHREDEVLWWGKGGVLYGESEKRIAFLRALLEELPGIGHPVEEQTGDPNERKEEETAADRRFRELLEQCEPEMRSGMLDARPKEIRADSWRLRYYGHTCPYQTTWTFGKTEGRWKIEQIDVWNMSRKTVIPEAHGKVIIPLTGKEGMAVLATKQHFTEKIGNGE